MFKYLFFLVILFLHISLVKPIYLGFPLMYFLSLAGIVSFSWSLINNKFKVEKNIIIYFFLTAIIFFSYFITLIINQYFDIFYLKEIVQFNILSFFSAYLIVSFYLRYISCDSGKFAIFFSVAVFFQLLISFLALLSPYFSNILFGLIDSTLLFENSLDSFSEHRMVVVGTPFFGSAIVNCFTLLLIASVFRKSDYKGLLIIMWYVISILGMLSARTTIIGIILSFLILFSQTLRGGSRILIYLMIPGVFLSLVLSNIELSSQFNSIKDTAFEFLINYKGSKASESTSELVSMYDILPNNFKTWVFGDGYFKSLDGMYYKGTDIGYLRIIFSSGLLGLILFVLLSFFVILNSKISYKFLFLILFIALNLKGFSNMIYLFMLFFVFQSIVLSKYKYINVQAKT